MNEKHRVAHVFVTLCTGGAEQHLLTVLRQLDRDRFEPLVICLAEPGNMAVEVEALGVEVLSLHIPPRRLSRPWAIARMVRVFKEWKIDILHAHLRHAAKYGRIAGLLARVPAMVITVHDVDAHPARKHRLFSRWLDGHTNCTIAVSEAVRESLLREGCCDVAKLVVIPHGITLPDLSLRAARRADLRREFAFGADTLVIALAARLVPVKRVDLLIRAFGDIAADFASARLLLVGDGPERSALEQLCAQQRVADRVTFTGMRRDVPSLLLGADLFVLPSDSEAAGIALLEAMAAGLPVIASRVGGIPEIVGSDGGLLFTPGDCSELTAVLRKLLDSGQLRENLGEAARKTVATSHSAEAMTRTLEAVYARIAM